VTFEIRSNGVTLCTSSIPNAGYQTDTLRDMERSGMHLYCDGKRLRTASLTKTHPLNHEKENHNV
jgi:hypothetical protein